MSAANDMYNFSPFKKSIKEIKDWLKSEFSGIRTGRATPAVLDNVTVEMYGTKLPLNQSANIVIEDPKTLRVSPWDAAQVKTIEKALRENDMGLSVTVDDTGLRVSFPELSTERRTSLCKVVRDKREQARISLRSEREKVWEDIQKQEKEGDITEDEKFRFKEEMQKYIDEAQKELDEMTERKEKEILEE